MGQDAQALADYSTAIAFDPNLAEAYNIRASIYMAAKQCENAWNEVRHAEKSGVQMKPETLTQIREQCPQ